jgi:hypothetical protein
MTEKMPVTQPPQTAPTFPPGRYGRRREPARPGRRWLTAALATVVALGGVAVAAKLYRQYTLAPYQVQVLGVTDLSETAVTVTFEVRRPAGQSARCTVVAHTRDGEEVGRAELMVPSHGADDTAATVTYTLATTKRPMTAEVPGCGPA